MSDTRERKGRFRRLVNRQRPRQLFNFLESKALQIRHWRRKSLGTSPTSAQDFAGKSPAVGQNICWTLNTKHDFTSLDDNEAHHKQKGNDRLLNPTATHQYSIENIYELIKLAGLIPVSIQDNIGAASPKDAPFLESELLFGAGFPRDNIFCYRARVPIQDNSCRGPDHEFRRDPTQQAGRLLCPEEEPLNRKQRHLACPFLLHDSITYEGRPGCRGAAFPNPSRLKEHLYRCHKQKPHCTKCGEPFVDESSHADHKVCSTNFVHPVTGKFLREFKGFNKEQEAKLRDKKRKRGGSNEEKWKDIFNILFPDATEVPNPYYEPPTHERRPDNMNYGIINNLFGDHVPDTENMARSRIEKMTGPLPEADGSEMKEIFRDFAFGSLKALRSPTAGSMKKRCLASNISMESQVSLCSSSTSLPFKPVPHAKRHTGPSNRGILDHEDASPPVPNRDRRTAPDIAEVLPGIDIDFWLTEIPGIFGQSSRPSPPLRPSPESPLNQLSQLSPPSRACPAGQSSQPSQQREQSQSVTVADKVKFAIEGPSPTQEAAEDVIHTQQEATAETCEEKVSNNLKLTPEECLAAALQQKTPPWQGPEDDSSHD